MAKALFGIPGFVVVANKDEFVRLAEVMGTGVMKEFYAMCDEGRRALANLVRHLTFFRNAAMETEYGDCMATLTTRHATKHAASQRSREAVRAVRSLNDANRLCITLPEHDIASARSSFCRSHLATVTFRRRRRSCTRRCTVMHSPVGVDIPRTTC